MLAHGADNVQSMYGTRQHAKANSPGNKANAVVAPPPHRPQSPQQHTFSCSEAAPAPNKTHAAVGSSQSRTKRGYAIRPVLPGIITNHAQKIAKLLRLQGCDLFRWL
jgi:hypothetical protein